MKSTEEYAPNNIPNIQIKERGTILLATLLLLAVITVIAVGMAERTNIDIKRTSQLLTAQQAYFYVKSAEIWGVQRLKALPLIITKDTSLGIWPQTMATLIIPGGSVTATLSDAQGEFYNLNNLSDPIHQQSFYSLLDNLITTSDANKESEKFLMSAIVSWISPPGRQSDVLSDQYYLSLTPPYRAAHQIFVSPSELRLVKGITPEIYNNLFPVMIALPESSPTTVNVNTATLPVLTSIDPGLSINDAQAIIQLRQGKGGFRSVDEFFSLPILKNRNMSVNNFSVESDYFLLTTVVTLNNQQLTVYTLFRRTKNITLKTNDVKLLWQLRQTL